MTYQTIIDNAKQLSDTQHDTKNSSTGELLSFLNRELKTLYLKQAGWENKEVTTFVTVTPEQVESVYTSGYQYKIPIPADLLNPIGLYYERTDREKLISGVNMETINGYYYFSTVYQTNLELEYIKFFEPLTDLTLELPRRIQKNQDYLEYRLAIAFCISAQDYEQANVLEGIIKKEKISISYTNRPAYI